jgi:hypothetical protein
MPCYTVRVVDYQPEYYDPVNERFSLYPTWDDALAGAADETRKMATVSGDMWYHNPTESMDMRGVVYSELVEVDGNTKYAVLIHPLYPAAEPVVARPEPAHAIMNPEEEDDDETLQELQDQKLEGMGFFDRKPRVARSDPEPVRARSGTLVADDRCFTCLFSPSGLYNEGFYAPCMRCRLLPGALGPAKKEKEVCNYCFQSNGPIDNGVCMVCRMGKTGHCDE